MQKTYDDLNLELAAERELSDKLIRALKSIAAWDTGVSGAEAEKSLSLVPADRRDRE